MPVLVYMGSFSYMPIVLVYEWSFSYTPHAGFFLLGVSVIIRSMLASLRREFLVYKRFFLK